MKVVDHKDCSNVSKDRSLQEFINGFQYQISILYGVKREFREIVAKFSANGSMTAAILEFLSVNSVAELRDAQEANSILKEAVKVPDEAALAIAAVKILNEYFEKDRKLWNLVEKKARKYILQASSGITKEALNTALESFQPMYNEFKA